MMSEIKECEEELGVLRLNQERKTFIDMPEMLIRNVCLYLPSNQLCHSIRNVCRELRSVVDNLSVVPIGRFLVKSPGGLHVMTVYFKNKKISICGSKIELTLPKNWSDGHTEYFKAAFKGKFVMKKDEGVFEYRSDKKDWKSIEEPPEQFHSYQTCWISHNVLVSVGMQMGYMPAENWTGMACKVQLLNVNAKSPKWITPPVYRDNPLGPAICNPVLFNIENGSLIMFGGYDDDKETLSDVYKGVLLEDENLIRWTRLQSMPSKRMFAAAFKLKNKVFIMGGMNGDQGMRAPVEWTSNTTVFDLDQQKWVKGPDTPYTLEFPKAFVDSQEKYAFISATKSVGPLGSRGRSENGEKVILTYNEKEGFQEVEEFDVDDFSFDSDWDVIHTME